jgi:hypothetical protein
MGGWYPPGGSRVWNTGCPAVQAQGLPGRRELDPFYVGPRIDVEGNRTTAEAVDRRAQVPYAEAEGADPIHYIPCGIPPTPHLHDPKVVSKWR